jgi:hypothetical protein
MRNSGNAPGLLLKLTTARIARFFTAIGSLAEGLKLRPSSPEALSALPGHSGHLGLWLAEPKENASIGLALGQSSCNNEEAGWCVL